MDASLAELTEGKDILQESSDRIEQISLKNGGKIVIAGIAKHTTSLPQVKTIFSALDSALSEKGTENIVFLGEGSAVSAGMQKQSVGEAILGGDQQAIAFHAKELGIEKIDSWDMTLEDQLKKATELYGADNALIWMLSQSSIHLKNQGKSINLDNILGLLDQIGISKDFIQTAINEPQISELLEDVNSLENYLKTKTGLTLEELNLSQDKFNTFAQVANPFNSDEQLTQLPEALRDAGKVAGGLSQIRDKNFIDKVNEYSAQNKTLFVSCGGAHVSDFVDKLKANQLIE